MIKHLIRAFLVPLSLAAVALANDSPEPTVAPGDPDLATARTRIAAKDWQGAAQVMQKAVARDPRNADYHNLLAYAVRNGANPDMDVVFKHYQEALRLDPKHRGAHEYIGEAYLMVGNLAKAREHLAALNRLCFFSCEEYRDLKKAIESYETKKK
ncbi:MAG TPA: tetratricopeptide repeat protein [Methylomirabilota bacterium]|nr:tetratricopeptide repeat protein [Methylomirabilota bacterium]